MRPTCRWRPGEAPNDLTEYARLFLECVRATGEMFGASHIIQVQPLQHHPVQASLTPQIQLIDHSGPGADDDALFLEVIRITAIQASLQ